MAAAATAPDLPLHFILGIGLTYATFQEMVQWSTMSIICLGFFIYDDSDTKAMPEARV